jgi:hypothetical protein
MEKSGCWFLVSSFKWRKVPAALQGIHGDKGAHFKFPEASSGLVWFLVES